MSNNIRATLTFKNHPGNTCITVADRDSVHVDLQQLEHCPVEIDFSVSFPNQLCFTITNMINNEICLENLSLGGLALSKTIIDQICNFTPAAGSSMFTPRWFNNGKITIDLFAGDWLQYHLLYRNKITF